MFSYKTESELHQYLLSNFSDYFEFSLLADEYELAKGRIDFLGEDEKNIYIVELKKDLIDKHTINQIQKYMDTIKEEFPNKNIKGVAIAPKVISTLNEEELPKNISIRTIDDVKYVGKTHSLLHIDGVLKEQLENEAKEQNRSFNNLIETILKDYLASK